MSKLDDVQAMIKLLKGATRKGPRIIQLSDGRYFGTFEDGSTVEIDSDSPLLTGFKEDFYDSKDGHR